MWWWKFIEKYYLGSSEFYVLTANYRVSVSVLICSEVEFYDLFLLHISYMRFIVRFFMYLELFLVKYISAFTLYRDSMLLGYLVLAISVILHGISHLWDFSFNIYEISQSFCVDLSRYHSKNQAHPSICRYTS